MPVREIGLHLRYNGSFSALAQRALELRLPFFQSFLIDKIVASFRQPSEQDIAAFLALRQHFGNLFVHGSYWINLANLGYGGQRALARELALAKQLSFTHMILHPGAAAQGTSKEDGIAALAKTLNKLLRRERDITIVLENTAHGALTVGSDLQDFVVLKSLLQYPEKLLYCIDTAHAHSYGYSILDEQGRNDFIALLDQTLGIANIVLIHLNDTNEAVGSKIDRHQCIGQGVLGQQALKAFSLHPQLKDIPVLLELPAVSPHEEQENLAVVRSWHEGEESNDSHRY